MKKIVLSLFVFFSIALVSCDSTTTNNLDYSDFSDRFIYNTYDQLTQDYDTYYIYFYGPYCSHCLEIKQEALSTIALLKNDVVFFVEIEDLSEVNSEIDLIYTPSLVKIVDGDFDSIVFGGSDVLEALGALS